MMRNGLILVLTAALAAGAAGCGKLAAIQRPAPAGGTADFTTYAAIGTSISAGWESGGLVDHHQVYAFPARFAVQTGHSVLLSGAGTFTQPAISSDGIPPLLQVVSFVPLVLSNAGRTTGQPTNFLQGTAYHDMGIPGALLLDVADTTNYYATVLPVNRTNFTMFDVIARHRGSILAQVASLAPTFVSFEMGSNEVLGPAAAGSGTVPVSPAAFAALLAGTLDALQAVAPQAKLALVNVPDVTTIPFATTFVPFVLDASGNPVIVGGSPVTLIGPGGTPLSPADKVLLTAGDSLAIGTGFPVGTFSYLTGAPGNGRPLLDAQVLSTSEVTSLEAAIDAYNATIASQAAARGAALVDLHALLREIATTGFPFRGALITSDFITGGAFSLDGIHPTDLGHGLVCNAMISAVNATFGSGIPPVDLNSVATTTSSAARPASAEGRRFPWIRDADSVLAPLFPWRSGPGS